MVKKRSKHASISIIRKCPECGRGINALSCGWCGGQITDQQPDDPTPEEIEESCRLIRSAGFLKPDGNVQVPWDPTTHGSRQGYGNLLRPGEPRRDLTRDAVPFAFNFSDMSKQWRADALGEPYEFGE